MNERALADVSDDQRMRAAVDLAEGRPSEDAQLLRGRGTQRAIVVRVVGMLVAFGVGVVLALLFLPRQRRQSTVVEAAPPTSQLGLTCSIVGCVLILGTVVWLARKGRIRSGWRHLTFALTRRQRRDLRRQIMGRRDVVPAQLPVSRSLAVEMTRQTPQVLLMAGLTLTTLGSALSSTFWLNWVLFTFLVVCASVAVVSILRGRTRARRFLAAHPAPASEPVA